MQLSQFVPPSHSPTVSNKQPNQKNGQNTYTDILQRHIDDQQTHETMLNITNYYRNANQNYNEVSPHTGQNGHHQKNLQTINAEEGVEKRDPTCTALFPEGNKLLL